MVARATIGDNTMLILVFVTGFAHINRHILPVTNMKCKKNARLTKETIVKYTSNARQELGIVEESGT